MAQNAQHKRISKNRVSITYDVEDNGVVEKKELPFVVGVMGDYSGDNEDKPDVDEREFYNLNKDNFNQVMAQMEPRLNYSVPNVLSDDGAEIEVDIRFQSMDDFKPDHLVNTIEPLKALVDKREKLMTLIAKSDRSKDLEKLLKDILKDQELLNSLGDELGVNDASSDKSE